MMEVYRGDHNEKDDDGMAIFLIAYFAALWYNSLRNQSKLSRSAVLLPHLSAWQHLYEHGDDSTYLGMTGFNKISFWCLEACLLVDGVNRNRVGRPLCLESSGQLGSFYSTLSPK